MTTAMTTHEAKKLTQNRLAAYIAEYQRRGWNTDAHRLQRLWDAREVVWNGREQTPCGT